MKSKGQHQLNKLSAAKVRSIRTPGRYSDGNGLYLEVESSGAKRWMLRAVVAGKRRDFGLGGTTNVDLADARKEASRLKGLIRDGEDPIAARKLQKGLPTFEQAARTVYKDHCANWKNAKHRDQWITTLETYAFPIIGSLRVNKIESPEVLKVLWPIWLSKPETARRVKQRMGTVFDWAKAAGYRSGANPIDGIAKGLPKQTQPPKHHAALPYEEVPGFVHELHQSNAGTAVKLAFEFLILTVARTNEALEAKWDEIADEVWTIPASRMKNKRPHRVPLPPRCLKILREAKAIGGDDYVFPGQSPGRPLSNMSLLQTIRRMNKGITAHGFRSSFKDWATECTHFALEVSEAALSHTVRDKTEAAYRRGDIFEKRRQLMEAWESYVTSKAP